MMKRSKWVCNKVLWRVGKWWRFS